MSDPARGDVSPLDVLLLLMRVRWQEGDGEAAAALARSAAPYVHPRARPAPVRKSPGQMTDAELRRWIEHADAPMDDLFGG